MRARGALSAGTLLLLGGICLLTPGVAAGGRGPDALLLASEQAEKKVSYAGTKVLRFFRAEDGTLAGERIVKVWHREPSQTRLEMVAPAESLGMVVLETGTNVWVFHPRKQSWRQMSWRAPDARPHLLLKNYDTRLQGREKVAGRTADVVRLTSRNPGNPSKIVWIDRQTKLALRQELFDPAGRRLSTTEFRDITFEPSLPANLFTVPAEAKVEPRRQGGPPWAAAKSAPAQVIEQPRYVPAGYELVQRFCMKRPGSEFAHLRYTDGLNTISLFIERCPHGVLEASGERHRGGRFGAGKGHGGRGGVPRGEMGQSFTMKRGDTRYTLVGNITAKELRRMAESIPAAVDGPPATGVVPAGGSGPSAPRWKR